MLNIPVRLFRLTVVFNPLNPDPQQKITLISDDFQIDTNLSQHPLPIPQGISMIVFDLITLPGVAGPLAEFDPEGAVTWFDPNNPTEEILQPTAFLVQAFNPNHLTIVDFNTAKVQNSHPFNLNVLYQGDRFSSDPVIVNEPPMQPGEN